MARSPKSQTGTAMPQEGQTRVVEYRTITGSGSQDLSDQVVRADASGGSLTYTLLTAVGQGGTILTVKKIDSSNANTVTVAPAGGETIDGDAAGVTLTGSLKPSVTLMSNNVSWDIL